MKTTINTPVTITAMGFGRNMRAIPRRMEYEGRTYDFIDAGLRMVIRRGGQMAQFLTMSDGVREFHLKSDNHGGSWTLLGIS